jgi:hypothetical protein
MEGIISEGFHVTLRYKYLYSVIPLFPACEMIKSVKCSSVTRAGA